MAKNLKLKIKNTELAKAAGLDKLKAKLAGEKLEADKEKPKKAVSKAKTQASSPAAEEEKPRRIRAKTKSDFAPVEEDVIEDEAAELLIEEAEPEAISEGTEESSSLTQEELETPVEISSLPEESTILTAEAAEETKFEVEKKEEEVESLHPTVTKELPQEKPMTSEIKEPKQPIPAAPKERLGPTGRHIKDLLPPKKEKKEPPAPARQEKGEQAEKQVARKDPAAPPKEETAEEKERNKKVREFREFKDLKPAKKQMRPFDARDRQGLSSEGDDGERWRKKRSKHGRLEKSEEQIIRPSHLKIRLPITVKDLASEMKFKSSELIQKLFLQGIILTLNDVLDDETTVQFLGSEFSCEITIDTSEEERIQISSQTVQEEIKSSPTEQLSMRSPVVAFMGHVDHGKTSLIDAIRKSNVAAGEAGAITQHMGAFRCKTAVGDLTILDTPGHEAFSSMRARGAEVTDIVVLVVAGDEGIREQTTEAFQHAKAAGVTIVVAINKSDKPNFNVENVYRQLSEIELLPEAWGGQTITVNTSAVTGEGISQLLEMLALQAEILELKANPSTRARGAVLESEMHKGLGSVATVLVQNGTLRQGDAVVFDKLWGRIKTMHDEHGKILSEAGPSTPVEITGLSGLPTAGETFIVVKNEKEARDIAETRAAGIQQRALQQKKAPALESLLQNEKKSAKKVLKLILRGDVQGSVEALKISLQKITSDKADVDIIFTGVGEISESDIQLAAASNAVVLGFHTQVESHAESLIKEMGVTIRLHDIIYHAIEDVKGLMTGLLDKIEEEKEQGVAEVRATFKASQLGVIAGCQVIEGSIYRNSRVRLVRDNQVVWKGGIASLKRIKEDVKEVKKGFECGILLEGNNEVKAGDLIQAYEIVYRVQEL